MSRVLVSGRLSRIVPLTAMLLFVSTVAGAATLTFDDVPLNSFGFQDLSLNGGYGGLSWTGAWNVVLPDQAVQSVGSAVSHPIEPSPGSCCVLAPFNFLGADFAQHIAGQNPANYALQVVLTGWSGGADIYSMTVALAPGSTHVTANFFGIDSLTVQPVAGGFATGPAYLLMDNFSYDFAAVASPVPEPTTLLLFGSGTLGLLVRRTRRSSRRGQTRNLRSNLPGHA